MITPERSRTGEIVLFVSAVPAGDLSEGDFRYDLSSPKRTHIRRGRALTTLNNFLQANPYYTIRVAFGAVSSPMEAMAAFEEAYTVSSQVQLWTEPLSVGHGLLCFQKNLIIPDINQSLFERVLQRMVNSELGIDRVGNDFGKLRNHWL